MDQNDKGRANINIDRATFAEIAQLAADGQRGIADQVRLLLREYKKSHDTTIEAVEQPQAVEVS